jgi:hypothetical protein
MSGLPNYKQFDDKWDLYASVALNTHYSDENDALDVFDETQLKFEPGSQFRYTATLISKTMPLDDESTNC